ncbi:LOW QUALITY PROTEIN: hypothetical protein TorRG33x02_333020 [Trema orientale]|uniref:Uncharacterized protein n=1 Tax=Trema orientale TaxID=63057 RepID=A0A2P5B4Q9_TREOI|nr:LOW QUALITY PROTEIN: hypothetical protein TorRG33x02_333020 [Trema orientale]
MTQSSRRFVSYSPCPSNKKITIADGTLVTVVGRGDVVINQNFKCSTCGKIVYQPSFNSAYKRLELYCDFLLYFVNFRTRA